MKMVRVRVLGTLLLLLVAVAARGGVAKGADAEDDELLDRLMR
jgi:hypothetical protein